MSNVSIEKVDNRFHVVENGVVIARRGSIYNAKSFLSRYCKKNGITNPLASNRTQKTKEHNITASVSPVQSVQSVQPKFEVVKSSGHNSVFVPDQEKTFIPFGAFKQIEKIIASRGFYPIYVSGPTGNGKSTMVEQACARNNRSYIRLQINQHTDEEQLIGTKTLVDGNIEIVEGPVLLAMRTGSVVLLDEIDAADPGSILCLQSICEGKPYYFKLKNEIVYPAHGFNIIATGNTKGRGSVSGNYIGTNMQNEAFLERFPVTICHEYPAPSIEKKIITQWMHKFECFDEKLANTLVKWAAAIRKTFDEGAIDDIITTRRLVQIVQGYSIFGDAKMVVELACNRFDTMTRNSFIDVFDKILPDDTPITDEESVVVDDSIPQTNIN